LLAILLGVLLLMLPGKVPASLDPKWPAEVPGSFQPWLPASQVPGSFGAPVACQSAPNIAGNLAGGFAADVAREGACKFGSQMAS